MCHSVKPLVAYSYAVLPDTVDAGDGLLLMLTGPEYLLCFKKNGYS
jgi:hypothetical protein